MKLLGGLLLVTLALGAAPVTANAKIPMGEVKRLNREHMRLQCFDTCVARELYYCKRVGNRRARCVGRVTWQDDTGVSTCRIINRYKLRDGEVVTYEINKRCHPA